MTALDVAVAAPDDAPPPPRRARRKLFRTAVLLLVVTLVALLFVNRLSGPPPVRSVLIGKPVLPLTGTTIDGKRFDLADWRGQVVLVNVWASWCVPCQREQPLLAAAYRELNPRGMQMVGIDVRDTPAAARAFQAKYGQGPWPSVSDPDGKRAVQWGTFALPETYLIDTDGVIVRKAVGMVSMAWIRSNVVPLLPAGAP